MMKITAVSVGPDTTLCGWVHRIRTMGRKTFIVLRDGTDHIQCIVEKCPKITLESSIKVTGDIQPVPEGKTSPGKINLEMLVTSIKIIGLSPDGDDSFSCQVQHEIGTSKSLDKRHLMLRGDRLSGIMKQRANITKAFRAYFENDHFTEVTPPCLVQTECEGGSNLFKLDFFGEYVYLTQSSQLYLESVIPALGDVFCIQQSFRAEKSRTRRHLAEYAHLEIESPFITFEDLLRRIEEVVRYVCKSVGHEISDVPFKRMRYSDAIIWLKEHDITKEDGTYWQFGEDIPEAPERIMTDTINQPILLTHFPGSCKAFYMSRDPDDDQLTESVDLLLPGVGEIVGGSMRIWDETELRAAFKKEKLDPSLYEWFIDQRKYGSVPHGGFGLGIERFVTWLCGLDHIRDSVMYPRYIGHCTP